MRIHLVVVCCHAVFVGPDCVPNGDHPSLDPLPDPYDERQWLLEPFQKSRGIPGEPDHKEGEHITFMRHMAVGLNELRDSWYDPVEVFDHTVLMFSGGPTKQQRTSSSEASSYLHAARCAIATHWPDETWLVLQVMLEELATDSFQNFLFSLLECKRMMGEYPDRLTMVGHEFKRNRFEVS